MMNGYSYNAMNNTLTISASFAKKASKAGTPEYNVILTLRRDFPGLTIRQEEKREGKKNISFAQMKDFISLHHDAKKLSDEFEKVKKLSRVQPMPYRYVKTWFENRFPYYADQPTFDAEGYIIDPATAEHMKDMYDEVAAADQAKVIALGTEKKNAGKAAQSIDVEPDAVENVG